MYEIHDRVLRQVGNANRGVNQVSLSASRELLKTRQSLAQLFNIKKSERVIFTQNVTEAINVGLQGLLQPGDHVILSSLEHNAVIRPIEYLKTIGIKYTIAPCNQQGHFDLAVLNTCLHPETKLLCFTHASNVLGSIMPLAELGSYARKHNLIFMVDAAQSAGILPLDVENMNIDFLAFTGHKSLLGPQGTGGYYASERLRIKPLIYGGTGIHSALLTQPESFPEGMESGTRNIAGLAALRAGIEYLQKQDIAKIRAAEIELMTYLLEGLRNIPGMEILGPLNPAERVGLVTFNIAGYSADELCLLLDRNYNIITRSGLHCAPLAHQTAGTLERGALRVSLGVFNTKEDLDNLLGALRDIVKGRSNNV